MSFVMVQNSTFAKGLIYSRDNIASLYIVGAGNHMTSGSRQL